MKGRQVFSLGFQQSKALGLALLFLGLFLFSINDAFSQQGRVLIITDMSTSNTFVSDVKDKLTATGVFSVVDAHNTGNGLPSLTTLNTYDAILTYWGTSGFPSGFGNLIANYVDNGGGVVSALFNTAYSANNSSSFGITERFRTAQYYLISSLTQGSKSGSNKTMIKVLPNHELLNGVNTFSGGDFSSSGATVSNNSTVVATWGDNTPLIVYNDNIGSGGARRVDLDFFPPSSTVDSRFWTATTSGVRIDYPPC
jgi:hypothetical protein